jgi:uncharacterized protein (TIGR02246 family)
MKRADAETAIRQIVADQVAAWNQGNGASYARAFASDGSFTNIYGQSFTGHEAFEQRHVTILATFFRHSVLEAAIRSLRFPGTSVAVAEVDTVVRGVGSMPQGVRVGDDGALHTRLLQVFELRDGEWRIVAHHNVQVAA